MSVGSWLMGTTTGVRRTMTSVSRRLLMFCSQFVESLTTTANVEAVVSLGVKVPVAEGPGLGSWSTMSLERSKKI